MNPQASEASLSLRGSPAPARYRPTAPPASPGRTNSPSAAPGPEPAVHDLTAREMAEVVSRAVALLTRRGQGLLADRLDECLRRARDREHLLAALADLRRRLDQAEDAHLAE